MARNFAAGALVGALLTTSLVALMAVGHQLAGLPFAPYDVLDWLTRTLPGPIVTAGLDALIGALGALGLDVAQAAKTAEQIFAAALFCLIGAILGGLYFAGASTRRARSGRGAGLILGVLLALPLVLIHLVNGQSAVPLWLGAAWLVAVCLAWAVALSRASSRVSIASRPRTDPPHGDRAVELIGRRQFLISLGTGTAVITVMSGALAAALARSDWRLAEGSAGAASQLPNADDPIVPPAGTRPEYTPVADHYRVFIRAEPTVIDGSTWRLPITGLVDRPLRLTLDDLRRYPRRDRYVTLSCISGGIGSPLIGTTKWTGADLHAILSDAGVRGAARHLRVTSGDGFQETVSLDLIASEPRIMLCYAWDDRPLPVEHGFPLRIWIPDRYGMKQPKWITGIELVDEYREGFWVVRGWDEVARVKATSVIDTVAVDSAYDRDGRSWIPVGGIAFAGARGISQVEVRVDGGDWQPARLRTPLSEVSWVLWRYDWPWAPGRHTFEVRCVEGGGVPQIERRTAIRPGGATGLHHRTVDLVSRGE